MNLVLCLMFPIAMLWFVPKYVMRREYGKAVACVAVPLIALMLLSALMAA